METYYTVFFDYTVRYTKSQLLLSASCNISLFLYFLISFGISLLSVFLLSLDHTSSNRYFLNPHHHSTKSVSNNMAGPSKFNYRICI